MYVQRDLYGGAIRVQAAPDLVDASDIRQVPDTQEVFMYPDSAVSIVVEILQKVDSTQLDDAAKFHFSSLAHDNSALSSEVESVTFTANDRGDETPAPVILKGFQSVPKFNHTVPDKVKIFLALFRIESKAIDLVVTFNVPLESVDQGAVDASGRERAEADFNTFVQSLRILDFGLFA